MLSHKDKYTARDASAPVLLGFPEKPFEPGELGRHVLPEAGQREVFSGRAARRTVSRWHWHV